MHWKHNTKMTVNLSTRSRFLIIFCALFIVIITGIIALSITSPETTTVTVATCIQADDDCIRLPQVESLNLDNETVIFPDDLATDLVLIVMPFDRDQQVDALDWVPVFQDLAQENDNISYYNLAILPDLAPPIRTLVQVGMSGLVSDTTLRQITVITYLDDIDLFTDSMSIPDVEAIHTLILNQAGEVLWQAHEAFSPELEAQIREQVTTLIQ